MFALCRRQIIEGPLDVHPTKTAIVVHYSMDARVLSESLETMGADAKDCQKMCVQLMHFSLHGRASDHCSGSDFTLGTTCQQIFFICTI